MTSSTELDLLCINTLRTLSIDAVQKADSGHPGLPLGAAPMAYVLWQRHLKHNPSDPKWADRDRFILSPGHGCMLHYALLHLTGYPLSMDDLKSFRQLNSKTPGHPEAFITPGVEATTGPLGQGHANAVGMAIAERALAHRFNKPGHTLVDHFTYAIISDGDVMEGVASEAASLAGHLKLGKLICLYDANNVTLDGPLNLSFSEDVAARYESYGWHVQHVKDGDHDLAGIDKAIVNAKAETQRPSLIIVNTTIGFGSPNKAGKSSVHGSPLGDAELQATKKALGWDPEKKFFVPSEALAQFRKAVDAGKSQQADWEQRLKNYAQFPEMHEEWTRRQANELPKGFDWKKVLPEFKNEASETRTTAGKVLGALASALPEIIGGDADLGGSTKTNLKDAGFFEGQNGSGRNIAYGVREHAMASISNGIAYHGGLRAFDATFFCFSDYMRPAVRLAALNHLPVVHVWTHDSVGLGEDGPTHQAVEQLASLRAMPGLWMVRPCDGAESAEAWRMALERKHGPTGLVLSRQKVPFLDRARLASASGLHKGAYVLLDAPKPQAIVMSSGSEVQFALEAAEQLQKEGISTRVVSMPCWEAFRAQDKAYRDEVLPPSITARVSLEAGCTFGWREWVGDRGISLGVDRYGMSAPWEAIYQQLGLTSAAVVQAVKQLVR